ncbi:MAG TPA: hypothetical protein V6D14_03015 [Coleofasciculaceae cyanobacterium]
MGSDRILLSVAIELAGRGNAIASLAIRTTSEETRQGLRSHPEN